MESDGFMACTNTNRLCVTRKGSLLPESVPYQKKDGHAWPRLPFFWHDIDFLDFFLGGGGFFFFGNLLIFLGGKIFNFLIF